MPVVTFSGNAGSYARDMARSVADALHLDYVDHALLVEAARWLGVTVERLEEIDERTLTFGERVSHMLSTVLERSAGIGSVDPMIGTANLEAMLARTYEDEAGAGIAAISDPILGMKLSRKASRPQSTGKSSPNAAVSTPTPNPVTRLVSVLMPR